MDGCFFPYLLIIPEYFSLISLPLSYLVNLPKCPPRKSRCNMDELEKLTCYREKIIILISLPLSYLDNLPEISFFNDFKEYRFYRERKSTCDREEILCFLNIFLHFPFFFFFFSLFSFPLLSLLISLPCGSYFDFFSPPPAGGEKARIYCPECHRKFKFPYLS